MTEIKLAGLLKLYACVKVIKPIKYIMCLRISRFVTQTVKNFYGSQKFDTFFKKETELSPDLSPFATLQTLIPRLLNP
jgi:hypothetical protein